MKSLIIKLIFSFTIILLWLNLCSNAELKSKNGIGIGSNYKINISNLISNNYKKYANKDLYKSKSQNCELDRLSGNLNKSNINNEIFFKGWFKYFKYSDGTKKSRPKEFFKNEKFEERQKINIKLDKEVILKL